MGGVLLGERVLLQEELYVVVLSRADKKSAAPSTAAEFFLSVESPNRFGLLGCAQWVVADLEKGTRIEQRKLANRMPSICFNSFL